MDILKESDLDRMISQGEINGDIIIRGEKISTLKNVKTINGYLGISDSSIKSLGELKEVKGDFFISIKHVYSNINSLENLEFVGGDLILRYSNIKELGALKKVGGKLSLRDTDIENLGFLQFVGGDLYLPKRLEKDINLANLTVKGKVRFWNDSKSRKKPTPKSKMGYCNYDKTIPDFEKKYIYSFQEISEANAEQLAFYNSFKHYFLQGKFIDLKGNDSYSFLLLYDLLENHDSNLNQLKYYIKTLSKYYPKTKIYGESAIRDKLKNSNNFEKAWELTLQQEDHISIEKVIEYEKKLNKELLNGALIIKIGGFSHLTYFGRKNIKEIEFFADKQLEKYKSERKSNFFDLFLKNGKPIKDNKKKFFDFLKLTKNKSAEIYDYSFYKKYFLSEAEYEHYKAIDEAQVRSGYINSFPHVVEKAILNQFRLILKKAEDLYRESIGMPKVGEGWISETELFYKITDNFKNDEVIHHASPQWLGRQHLDIYFTKYNIAIEYQGAQHYEPIDFFGGQEAFEKTVERDKRKKYLCKKYKCHLIYVRKGYDLQEIINKINEIKMNIKE